MSNATVYHGTTRTVELVGHECGECGVHFAFSEKFQEDRKRDHRTWYCPNGHPRVFTGEPTADRKLRHAEAQNVALRDQMQAAVHEAETVRLALLRDRQRFANGVCPCCNRSFENVRRHMVSKHPDYDPTRVAQPGAVRFGCSCGRSFNTVPGLRRHQTVQRGPNWTDPSTSKWSAHLTRV